MRSAGPYRLGYWYTSIKNIYRSYHRSIAIMLLLLILVSCGSNEKIEQLIQPLPGANKIDDLKPTVLLISFDGFRWDYLNRGLTPNLDRLIASGTRSEALIPVFPSKTFPNHYSIVTGLLPKHHGIISNKMYDPELNKKFTTAPEDVSDSRWWQGEPIWITAEKQHQSSATYYWPGSDVEIGGLRPNFWKPYNKNIFYRDRIIELLGWLDLPVEKRPTIITLYIEEVDQVSHEAGPDSEATNKAIKMVDSMLGLLYDGLIKRGIGDQVNMLIVSDHGMSQLEASRAVIIDEYINSSQALIINESPLIWIWPKAGQEDTVYQSLKKAAHLQVYRKDELPASYQLNDNQRIPPIIAVADEGWSTDFSGMANSVKRHYILGAHGYDPELPAMQGIFIAHGPAFSSGRVVEKLHNIDIYNLMAHLLNLEPAPNDGCKECINKVLKPAN